MKKYLFLTMCLAVLGISQAKAQAAKVALQHKGKVTFYNADELQKALDVSSNGDTLFLNEGTYKGNITISQKVSVIGAGENTIIDGSVTITTNGDLSSRILDGLYVKWHLISIKGNTKGLTIRKCKFGGIRINGAVENAIIDRCFQESSYGSTGGFGIGSEVKSLRVVNSKIYDISGVLANVSNACFINCNIAGFGGATTATFVNSVVNNYVSSYTNNCDFSYCLLYNSNNVVNEQNCQIGAPYGTNVFQANPSMIGSDGTVVGIYGGTTPFTLVPSVPIVKSYDLKVDTANKKLNVNISVESK